MKTSLKKLQKFAALRHDRRAPKHHQSPALDELSRATQDMEDMRDCYDRLLSAAAATANSVYEFSESLREMGDCLLEKTALNDDEESGKVLLMMGKAQFELQKLVDDYRSHIFRTITIPSESLLNELRIVEEMKQRCDGKRDFYEDLLKKQKDKGRLRNSKGENFSSPPLEEAHDEYDEEANVFVFRMKSLKQGQSRSFLTQASRHHAAQMYFFKKAVKSLEAIEPHVRLLAEQQHIDYQFSGLEDDGHGIYDDDDDGDDDDDDDDDDGSDGTDDSSDTHDDEELSFDNGQNGVDCVVQEVSTLKNSMELDTTDMMTFSPDPKAAKEILPSLGRNFSFQRGFRATSVSAPLFPENKLDSGERMSQLGHSSSRKFTSYVLPTPDETRSPVSGKIYNEAPPQTRQTDLNIRHSSPLGPKKYEKLGVNGMFSGPIIIGSQSVLKERNSTPKPSPLPSPLSETLPSKQLDPNVASYAKKAKRQAFSGPLTRKSWPNNPNVTASGPIASSAFPLPYSGSLLRTPLPQPTSNPKLPSLASHNFVSSPKISELHELPRPPNHIVSVRPFNRSAHSGPLISQTNKMSSASVYVPSAVASALPMPPPPVELSRSYSNPARSAMDMKLRVPLEATQNLKKAEDIFSPPLTPISLLNVLPPCQPFK